ncbi:hypothetical protein JCM10213_002647 [Rhodosporidiobolus nylandii]
MPALINTALRARINFPLPESKLANPQQYLDKFDINNLIPTQEEEIPIFDLREELEGGMAGMTAMEQLDEMGYAVVKHESQFSSVENLSTVEGTDRYLEETCELFKTLLGASTVIAWNSVIRTADEAVAEKDTKETRQKQVEKALPPSTHIKATAGSAHVDQDEEYARTIIKRAAGEDVFDKYSRLQIINLWRPLRGPVTNKPLAVSHFKTMEVEKDILRMAGSYGTAYSVSYSPQQRWGYLSHQMPSETLWLRCYDSNMGRNGEALYTGHVAADILNEPDPVGLEGKEKVPRISCEVRLVVLHE